MICGCKFRMQHFKSLFSYLMLSCICYIYEDLELHNFLCNKTLDAQKKKKKRKNYEQS